MKSKWSKFKLLMWKNYLLQIRNPLTTAFEIIIPILFALLLVFIRSLVLPEIYSDGVIYDPIGHRDAGLVDEMSVLMGAMRIQQPFGNPARNIFYYPTSPFIDGLMKNTKNALGWHFEFLGMNNISLFSEKIMQNSSFAGIEFPSEYVKNFTPDKLEYNLTFPGELATMTQPNKRFNPLLYNWWTNRLFPKFSTGARNHNQTISGMVDGVPSGYFQEGFLSIQQAIFTAFLKTHSQGFDLKTVPTIAIQRFPVSAFIWDPLHEGLQAGLPIFILLCFVYPCINIIKYITTEKEKQLKEVMKINGLDSWLHWTAWWTKCFIYMIIIVTLITGLCKMSWYGEENPTAVFTNSSFSVLWVFLLIYSITTITFCFMLSVFFSKASTAAAVGGLAWFLTYTPYIFIKNRYEFIPVLYKLFVCFLSNTAMSLGFNVIMRYEGTQEGMQWENVFNPTDVDDNFHLGHVWIMLIIDSIIYLTIALYVERIFPGDFGVAEKWNFPFTRNFWIKSLNYVELKEINNDEEFIELSDFNEQENENFEVQPKCKKVGIKIVNLRKTYEGDKIAVDGISLNLCENEITVLLGHNGAGKSTTMSMLTGMIKPSSGTAIIEGRDIRTDMSLIRSSIGFCPQHDILFDNLTVKDHITFYALLKGMRNREVNEEVKKYVKLLKLEKKINIKSKALSGGMKRKLSVAIALCGNSKIAIFDEPSSGVDPGSRRDLLELLQSEKKGRTILLSTHFMQDAEVLGDRIIIIVNGRLKAVGSPFFLKKQFGEGYRLVCVKNSANTKSDEVTKLLRKHIPDLQKESEIGTELSYCMGEKNVLVFQNMLRDLEEGAQELNIASYGISLTTLEEVFMKIGADNNQEKLSSNVDLRENSGNDMIQDNFYEYVDSLTLLTGFSLFLNQFCAMMRKKFLTSKRSLVLHLIQSLIAVLFISVTIPIVRTWEGRNLPLLELSLKTYRDTRTLLKLDDNITANSIEGKIFESYKQQFQKDATCEIVKNSIIDHYLEVSKESLIRANSRYLYGASIEESQIKMHFNNRPYHTTPISLGLIHNAILRAVTNKSGIEIKVSNKPLPYRDETMIIITSASNSLGFQLSFNLGFAMAFVASFYVICYVKEKNSKAKHLQLVSGINPVIYWLTAFLWDFLIFAFIAFLVILTFASFEEKGFATFEELKRIYFILLLFGFSFLPIVYVSTFLFETPAGGFIKMSIFFMFFGAAMHLVVFSLRYEDFNLKKLADTFTQLLMIVPHFSLCLAINDINVMNVNKEACEIKCKSYGTCSVDQCNFDYFSWDEPGVGRNIYYFILSEIISFCFLFLVEFRVFEVLYYCIRHKILTKILPRYFKNPPGFGRRDEEGDYDVLTEKEKVNNMSKREFEDYSLVMKNVSRYYKDFMAVNKLCVGIKPGEAFGLLGVNGAGKTSTFKMLTGDIKISDGEAFVNGKSLITNMNEVHKITGYCPQFDALIDNLTGRETLNLFAMSRGIPKHKLKDVIVRLADDFNFTKHLDKKVQAYSGGNRRKLSTAIALIGNPVIIYLDEPTTGMDVASKRNLWNVICNVRNAGKTIVLTTHSIEEAEALCTRLVIMVNGEFKCLGSIQHLKSNFGQGFDLVIKLKRIPNIEMVERKKEEVKEFISQEFPGAQLREEYYDLMAFRVPSKSLKWSRIFGKLQEAKTRLNIEDYSIAQASLEQIFLSFTMYQREGNN